jgi:hypothetical protein
MFNCVHSSCPPTIRDFVCMLDEISPISEQQCDHETGSGHRHGSGTEDGPELLDTEWYVLGRVLLVS